MSTNKLRIGSSLPHFNLKGTDDKFYNSEEYSECELMLVVFTCNHCPYIQAYENRLKEIQKSYKQKLILLAINSNDDIQYPEDSFDNMKIRADEKQFNFNYLRDDEQIVAHSFGATHTPEIFLFDKNRKLVFHGKIDDNWQDETKTNNNYLRDAIEEILSGKKISVPETFTIGCTIKWK